MRRYPAMLVILACVTATGKLYARPAADASEPASTQQPAPEKRSPPVSRQRPRQAEQPAPTFTPSEKIGADSAVSFPVDI